jgi:sec-independent protein translocase protein TatB
MFEVGFSEILLIAVIALVVLGPKKLPKLAADIGRWVGRARAMARQLRAQLDQEVNLEQMTGGSDAKPKSANTTPGTKQSTAPSANSAASDGRPRVVDNPRPPEPVTPTEPAASGHERTGT